MIMNGNTEIPYLQIPVALLKVPMRTAHPILSIMSVSNK